MVDVHQYCDVGKCPERATFEAGNELRCLAHKEAGMKPRRNICQVPGGGCTRQSSYGRDGGKPVVCTVHREDGMVQASSLFFGCFFFYSQTFCCLLVSLFTVCLFFFIYVLFM